LHLIFFNKFIPDLLTCAAASPAAAPPAACSSRARLGETLLGVSLWVSPEYPYAAILATWRLLLNWPYAELLRLAIDTVCLARGY